MLDVGQGLCKKVRDVDISGDVLHAELPPLDAILQPVKTHVYAFGQARSHGLGSQSHRTLVVAKQQSRRLGIAQVV